MKYNPLYEAPPEGLDHAQLAAWLQEALDKLLPERVWLCILEVLAVTGVADHNHLLQMTGLSRDQLRRALDKLQAISPNKTQILRPFNHTLPRAGQRGRAPAVYLLGEGCAILLQANQYPQAHACGLSEDRELLHALAMLDLHVLRGKPVLLSNNTGLRYAILLSRPRKLPKKAPFPEL